MEQKEAECIKKRRVNKKRLPVLNNSQLSCTKNLSLKEDKQIKIKVKSPSKSKSRPKSAFCTYPQFLQSRSKSKSKEKWNSHRNKTIANQSTIALRSLKKQQIQKYAEKIRKNNKKFIQRENSKQNLQIRPQWGVNEPRLNNYVLQTLAKLQKLRKHQQGSVQTFNTQKSRLKQSDVKLSLTPKKSLDHSFTKMHSKIHDKIVKSPNYEQKTSKKQKQKFKQLTSGKATQKPYKKSQPQNDHTQQELQYQTQLQSKNKQPINIPEIISKSFQGQFQCLQKNNLYTLNFRIVNRKIIQIQLAILKKAQSLYVNLNKGSLICQSINQTYQNITPKSSIILMTAISNYHKTDKYIYPELQIILNQKNGNFGIQRKILIPYTWLLLLDLITVNNFKQNKNCTTKIKNKSVIQNIQYNKQILVKMSRIFQNNFIKTKIKDNLCYLYGFVCQQENVLIRIIVNGNKCMIECQSSTGKNNKEILEIVQYILGI